MKFCTKCGNQLFDEAAICPFCGCPQGNTNVNDAPSMAFAILGFLFPIVGLILYLINKDTSPLKAKSAGKGALTGVIVSVVVYVIYFVAMGALLSAML